MLVRDPTARSSAFCSEASPPVSRLPRSLAMCASCVQGGKTLYTVERQQRGGPSAVWVAAQLGDVCLLWKTHATSPVNNWSTCSLPSNQAAPRQLDSAQLQAHTTQQQTKAGWPHRRRRQLRQPLRHAVAQHNDAQLAQRVLIKEGAHKLLQHSRHDSRPQRPHVCGASEGQRGRIVCSCAEHAVLLRVP